LRIRFFAFAALLLAALCLEPQAAFSQTPQAWVASFWLQAKAAGIRRPIFDAALGNFQPDPDVLKRASAQAEFNMAIWDYMDQMVSDERLSAGKAALASDASILARVEKQYGVDRYVVLAIWGIESHYGAVLSNPRLFKNTIPSLATLAYAGGKMATFGRQQLVAALKIIQRGDITLAGMTGSWAGAMGQTQFIPTTYEAYAVDFDGDGKRNIWTSTADALASTANYLRASGWQTGETWGYEVSVPAGFAGKGQHPVGWWAFHGVKRASGGAFPRPADAAVLYAPSGAVGPKFLLLANFRVIKRYNNADSYALAVGHLADRLRGGGDFATSWPAHEAPLSQDEAMHLQAELTVAGFYNGPIDGDLGSGSRDAIRGYQRAIGQNPDGVPRRALLQRLQGAK